MFDELIAQLLSIAPSGYEGLKLAVAMDDHRLDSDLIRVPSESDESEFHGET